MGAKGTKATATGPWRLVVAHSDLTLRNDNGSFHK